MGGDAKTRGYDDLPWAAWRLPGGGGGGPYGGGLMVEKLGPLFFAQIDQCCILSPFMQPVSRADAWRAETGGYNRAIIAAVGDLKVPV
jgi:hypothetical protein